MLARIEIIDFALIEHAVLDIRTGFTILTGETGAGKSILIDAIGAVCGNRVTRDMIRSDKEMSTIQVVFDNVITKIPPEILIEYGIETEEDSLILSREIYRNGKSYARINGRMMPLSALKSVTASLLDIHGQHENQAIFREEIQLLLLDRFGGDEVKVLLESYRKTLADYTIIVKALKEFITDEKQKLQLIDLLKYQINEISQASLVVGEDITLTERRRIITHSEKIRLALEKAFYLLNGDAELPALPAINAAVNQISTQLGGFDEYNSLNESLSDIAYRVEDVCDSIARAIDRVEVYPGEAETIDDRLDILHNLKHKYGGSIEAVLEHQRKAVEKLDQLMSGEERSKLLLAQKAQVINKLTAQSAKLYEIRSNVATVLAKSITEELAELGMRGTRFKVDILHNASESSFTSDGQDTVEFLISPNVGEGLKSLSRIASGGEASRIMLAIKTILADSDNIPILIFDEIDTGISGKTAGLLGEKMLKIASNHQVFCVTHMAQIAAKAQNHVYIQKSVRNDKTYTAIRYLDQEERVSEIARLLAGDENIGEAIKLARAMLT